MATNKEQHDARDGGRYRRGAEQQGDGQPENARELADTSGGSAVSDRRADAPPGSAEPAESGMGGTSDAGGAADDAAEGANLARGTGHDPTQRRGGV